MTAEVKLSSDIFDLWAVRETGECLVHQGQDDQLDPNVVSSFLSAFQMFGTEVDEGLSCLETQNFKFIYHVEQDLILVARVSRTSDPKYIKSKLEIISSNMMSKLGDNLANWTGNIEPFQELKGYISKELERADIWNWEIEINPLINPKYMPEGKVKAEVFSLVRFKGRTTLTDICKFMKLPESDAEEACRELLSNKILQRI
ncbi:MAG: hypothetical protein KAR35_06755 [Candidatus Heimdallarchaeota archaeon]|nr:hypothetical protein [Candidatus Heimdallarchaeota archaeon]MCK5049059.1 hypothetical protein [Candidatus Heimdallarchaeota archaeon]